MRANGHDTGDCEKRHSMTLTPVTDILFTSEPDPEKLREIAARAFDVSPSAVTVGPLL